MMWGFMDTDKLNKLKYLINKKKSTDEICEALGFQLAELYEYVKTLRLRQALPAF